MVWLKSKRYLIAAILGGAVCLAAFGIALAATVFQASRQVPGGLTFSSVIVADEKLGVFPTADATGAQVSVLYFQGAALQPPLFPAVRPETVFIKNLSTDTPFTIIDPCRTIFATVEGTGSAVRVGFMNAAIFQLNGAFLGDACESRATVAPQQIVRARVRIDRESIQPGLPLDKLLSFTTVFGAVGEVPELAGQWRTRASMPTARYSLGAVLGPDGRIYAVGGDDAVANTPTFTTVEAYDPTTDTWHIRANMPTARQALGVVAANSRVYAIGGWNGTSTLTTVEQYDPATNAWTTKAGMPTARLSFGAAVAPNGKIYAIGGTSNAGGTDALAILEEYDPTTNTWTVKAPMPTARRFVTMVAASNGKLYTIGGGTPSVRVLATVEEYDPTTNTWTAKAPMPTARVQHAAVLGSNGKIYVVSGSDGVSPVPLGAVEEYDPSTNTWAIKASIPTPRVEFGLVATPNGKLYAIGGYNGTNIISTVEEFSPRP